MMDYNSRVTNQKRLFLAALLIGMAVAGTVMVLGNQSRKPIYQSPYSPGATPPPVAEVSAAPIVTLPDPTPAPKPGEKSVPQVTFYQLVDTTEGPVLRPQTKPLAGTVTSEEEQLRQAIQAMTQGDVAPLPKGTKLLRLKREGKTVVLDLSRELKSNFSGGDRAEILVINALTATVAQLPDAQKLQVFIEGEAIETLAGGQSLLEPLTVPRR